MINRFNIRAAPRSPNVSSSKADQQNLNRSYLGFTAPALTLIALLTILPILLTFVLSLTSLSYTTIDPVQFIGLRNYERLLGDSRFLSSISTTLILIVVPVALQMIFGFGIALVMYERLPGMGWLRLIFVAPMVMPPIVMGLMWKILYTPQLGGINYFLSLAGIEGPNWLIHQGWALWAIILAALWGWTPFVALMLLAAMETFPLELYEAAEIDGASWTQSVWHITLPLLRPAAQVVLVFRVIEALAIFPIIFVVTGGGPAGATETMNYYAYVRGFNFLNVAYACAIIVMFFILLTIITTPATRFIISDSQER
jgi:multiple sugar transport system permease protein